jgi:hypothetical protein
VSLISEALRKARQQAAERDATGVVITPPLSARPGRSRLGFGLLLGAAITLAAAVTGAAFVWWALGKGNESRPSAETTMAGGIATDAAGAESEPERSASGMPSDGPDLAAPLSPDSPPLESRSTSPPPSVIPDGANPASTTARQPEPPPDQSATDSVAAGEPPARPQTVYEPGTRVYAVEADLDSVTLSLDYIAFRPDDPFAQINGSEVHVGSTIEGFIVEEITADHVLLRDDDGLLALRVR